MLTRTFRLRIWLQHYLLALLVGVFYIPSGVSGSDGWNLDWPLSTDISAVNTADAPTERLLSIASATSNPGAAQLFFVPAHLDAGKNVGGSPQVNAGMWRQCPHCLLPRAHLTPDTSTNAPPAVEALH